MHSVPAGGRLSLEEVEVRVSVSYALVFEGEKGEGGIRKAWTDRDLPGFGLGRS